MIYKSIAILENNERAFVQDLLLNINNEEDDNKMLSGENVAVITKRLIDRYKINFAEFMYQLQNEELIEFCHNNGLDKLYSNKLLKSLKDALLMAYSKLISGTWG